jgi:hypothetical protein
MSLQTKRPGSATLPDRAILSFLRTGTSTRHFEDTVTRFSSQRVRCPACGARRGFAPVVGQQEAGKCHACGLFLPPDRTDGPAEDRRPFNRAAHARTARPTPVSDARRAEPIEITPWRHLTTYDYHDEAGRVLFHVDRLERQSRYSDAPEVWRREKSFRQWHDDKSGQRVNNLHDVRRVLYELPAVLSAIRQGRSVWIVEGEKDADRLNDWFRHEIGSGDVATTAPGGSCKWLPEYSECLHGADVIVWGDNDEAGRRHVALLLEELPGVIRRLRVVPSDWFGRKEGRP